MSLNILGFSLRVWVRDDRGRRVTLLDAFTLPMKDADSEAARGTALRGHDRSWRRPLSNEEVWVGVLTACLPLGVIVLGSLFLRSHRWVMLPAALAAIVIASMLNVRANRRAEARRVLAAMLAERRCASCGYTLVGLPREEDGCTVCPECGAAWRLGGP